MCPLVTRTVNAGNVVAQDEEPSSKALGIVWMDTGDSPPSLQVSTGTDFQNPSVKIGDTVLRSDIAMLVLG